MKNINSLAVTLLFILLPLFSCVREMSESSEEIEKKILQAYITTVHKDSVTPYSSGIYILNEKVGNGRGFNDTSVAFVRYSTLDLKHNYLSTTYEEIAKQLGAYATGTYYGPTLLELGNYSLIKGVEEGLKSMKEGGKAKIIVPSWASVFDFPNSDKYHSTTTIYDIEVLKIIDNYTKYEEDTLKSFSKRFFGGIDTLSEGFYFKHLSVGSGDSVKIDEVVSVNYIGRLLDGFVFDTNIEDTARKYRIFSSDKQYVPLSVEMTQAGDSDATPGSGSVVEGFAKAIMEMRYGGKAATFFNSNLGYGEQSQSFGKRQQLYFYIEVLSK